MKIVKVLSTYDFGTERLDSFKKLGYQVFFRKESDITSDTEIEDIDALVCYNPFQVVDIQKLTNLKWIQLISMGFDQIPKDKVKNQGITVTNSRGAYSIPIAEWIILKILEIYKNTYLFYKQHKGKVWQKHKSLLELNGKTVGFIGTGSIAIEAAKRLKCFHTNVIGMNTSGRHVDYFDRCYAPSQLEVLLENSDVIVVTAPLTEETRNLIDAHSLKFLKESAIVINVSRGAIIEEKALIAHVNSGKLLGVALDVFDTEPLPEDSPLWSTDKIYITPHNSFMSEKRPDRIYQIIYDNLKRYIEGKELKNVVDIDRGY